MDRLLVAAVATTVISVLAAVLGVAWLVLGRPGAPGDDRVEVGVGTAEAFCEVFLDPFPLLDQLDSGETVFADNQVEYADRMLSIGLPADVDPRVREGLVVFAELNQGIEGDPLGPIPGDLPEPSPADDAAYMAFDDWARATCGAPY